MIFAFSQASLSRRKEAEREQQWTELHTRLEQAEAALATQPQLAPQTPPTQTNPGA